MKIYNKKMYNFIDIFGVLWLNYKGKVFKGDFPIWNIYPDNKTVRRDQPVTRELEVGRTIPAQCWHKIEVLCHWYWLIFNVAKQYRAFWRIQSPGNKKLIPKLDQTGSPNITLTNANITEGIGPRGKKHIINILLPVHGFWLNRVLCLRFNLNYH